MGNVDHEKINVNDNKKKTNIISNQNRNSNSYINNNNNSHVNNRRQYINN